MKISDEEKIGEILYESEVMGVGSAIIPFKITVEQTLNNGQNELIVKRITHHSEGDGKQYEDEDILMMACWKEDLESLLKQSNFILEYRNVHAISYRRKDCVVYVVPGKSPFAVIHPANEKLIQSMKLKYSLYHNSNLKVFPMRLNKGKSEIHYGLRLLTGDDFKSLINLLSNKSLS